jgi:hypothetical protein
MIGSSKINEQTDDLERLQELFDMGLNNSEISRIYRTNTGEQITRTHISAIRRGKRWNINKRSFVMKHELENQDCIETIIDGDHYKTCIAQIITDLHIYHIFFSYINSIPVGSMNGPLMVNKPLKIDLLKYHNKFVIDESSR